MRFNPPIALRPCSALFLAGFTSPLGVPKKHKTRSGRDQRRSHHAIVAPGLLFDKEIDQYRLPHVAVDMGDHYYYRGKKLPKN
jgi:ribosomal protein L32